MSDIAINPVTRRVQFTGNTGLGPFAFTFNILVDGDIAVFKNDTLLVLTTDYTVTTNADGTGSVTLTGSGNGTALVSADFLTIVGGRELSRTTDFVTAGDLLASSLNEQLDSNVIMVQQLDEKFTRALRIDQFDVTADMTIPAKDTRAGKFLAFDSNGLAIASSQGTWQGNWASGYAYSRGDIVKDTTNGSIYIANASHTSSGSQPISTNADAAKWDEMIDLSVITASQNAAAASAAAALVSENNAATSEVNAAFSDDWAVKTDGIVNDGVTTDYSSKAYAIGGTGVTDGAGLGPAKDWAIETTGTVDGTEYSSKEYAVGTQTRGTTGSAKDWATYTGGTVDASEYSAKHYAQVAAASVATFDDKYAGAKTDDTAADTYFTSGGRTKDTGDLYYSASSGNVRIWNGTAWEDAVVSTSGFATNGFAIAMAIAL
jgi:hypothetical protein